MMKGAISDLTEEQQAKTHEYHAQLQKIIDASEKNDEGLAYIALGLLNAEIAAKDS